MMAARSLGFRHLHLDVIDEPRFRQLAEPGPPKTPGHAVGTPGLLLIDRAVFGDKTVFS
jgi:hypothetical protein